MGRLLARTDLYFLLRYILNRPDVEKQWIFDRCKEVEKDPNGYLDLWAREHYKSTVITFAKSIQDIICSHGEGALVDRECTIGIFSHTRPIAKKFLSQIKRELEDNQAIKELFPDVFYQNPEREAPKWSEDGGLVVKRKGNPKESTVEAHGLIDGQPISVHFTHLIYDDVVTQGSVGTPEMMKKTVEMLALSYDLGTEGGVKRFVGTRYHFNDAYKNIINRGTAIPRIHPATHDGTMNGRPVLLTQKFLNEKRRDQGPYVFCFPKETPVLMGDWSEKPISEIKKGDYVVGYSFPKNKKTKLVKVIVKSVGSRIAPVIEVSFESGRIVRCTPDHKWYTGRRGIEVGGTDTHSAYLPIISEERKNCKVNALISVYNPDVLKEPYCERSAGYLSGMFDADGTVSGTGLFICQSEKVNPHICERIASTLTTLGYKFTENRHKEGMINYYIRGGREEDIRFLNMCRPAKSPRIEKILFDKGTKFFGKACKDKIVSIKEIGTQKVFNIETETGNYIAWGYAAKNSCQQLLDPKGDETQGMQRTWIRYAASNVTRWNGMNIYILMDPAGEKKKGNDYTAGWVVGLSSDRCVYVLDILRDRLNITQRTEWLFDMHRKYNPIEVRYEKYGKDSDIEHILGEQDLQNYRFEIKKVAGNTPKNDRIKRLTPYFEQGRIILPRTHFKTGYDGRTSDLVQDFIEQEYMGFPVGVHDDMLDSLARLFEPDMTLIWPKPKKKRSGSNGGGYGTWEDF